MSFAVRSALCLAVVAMGAAASAQVAPGYGLESVSVAPGSAFIGGFCLLPSGHYAVYDGADVREVDPSDGSTLRILHTPAGMPFGSFLEVSPDGRLLYFGESSVGSVVEIDLGNLSSRTVLTVSQPFDLCFDTAGRAFLSWSVGFGQGSTVSLLDLSTGALRDLIQSAEPTGPVVCDAQDGLYYGFPNVLNFPPPKDQSRVVHYSRSQIDAVLGGGPELLESDGTLVAQVDGTAAFALDGSGDLFVADNAYYSITEIDVETGAEQVLFDGPDFQGVTFLAFEPPAAGHAFERFQRPGSGALIGLGTDYVSFNRALRFEPRRAALSSQPASPLPPGPFELVLEDGVPDGSVLLFVTAGLVGSEFRGSNRSWPAPLWWGLDFSGGILLLRSFPLDGSGGLRLAADNPGLSGARIGVQAVVGSQAAGPFFATTQALELIFQ